MPTYYPIDETAARRAKEMSSFYDYKPGSATASYRQEVDKAAAIAEAQKSRVDPMYHEKIDRLLDTYARKLAENLNHGYAIAARCPSVFIVGPANFPVRKKEKQNRADDANIREWQEIQGILAGLKNLSHRFVHKNRANRKSGAQSFCERDDVRMDMVLLTAEESAGSTNSRLHFIHNQ